MKINIVDIAKWVKKNNLKEVKNSNVFAKSGDPDPEGLMSNEIFGLPGTPERKSKYGYITLGCPCIHPHVSYSLFRIPGGQLYHRILFGENKGYVDSTGKLFELKEGQEAPDGVKVGEGPEFLYKIHNDIDFKAHSRDKKKSYYRDEILRMVKDLDRDEFFIKVIPVIPVFYRDIDEKNGKINEINSLFYSRLINLSSILKNNFANINTVTEAHVKLMDTINAMYKYFIDQVGGNKAFFHTKIMGKTTNYGARLVIAVARYDSDNIENTEVSFSRTAIPLGAVIKCFAPFIVHGINNIMRNLISGTKYIYDYKTKNRYTLADSYENRFSVENIYNIIDMYYKSPEHRLNPFYLPTEEGKEIPIGFFDGKTIESSSAKNVLTMGQNFRILTYTDLFYMAAYNTVKDKAIYITRFPTEDHNNIYPSFMNIIPYSKTRKANVMGEEYPRYPDIDLKEDRNKIDSIFIDTLRLFPSYLPALGGDFDGDMVTVQGVFTDEANEDAKKFIYSIANIVDIKGGTMKGVDDVVAHVLYNMTKQNKIDSKSTESLKSSKNIDKKSSFAFIEVEKDKYILFFKEKNKKYGLPGGSVEKSESFEEGLIRELYEELDIKRDNISEMDFIKYEDYFFDKKMNRSYFYKIKLKSINSIYNKEPKKHKMGVFTKKDILEIIKKDSITHHLKIFDYKLI